MTVAEDRLLEVLKKIIENYDSNEESMYSEIDEARQLVRALEPRR